MNREIKFRGKRIDNGEWVYGGYFKHTKEDGIEHMIFDYRFGATPIMPETVGQYTGLKDKDGKEIYEEDIINHKRHSRPYSVKAKTKFIDCVVVWHSGSNEKSSYELNPQLKDNPSLFQTEPKFEGKPINDSLPESRWGYNWSVFSDCKIIGNIHDNPELLNKQP